MSPYFPIGLGVSQGCSLPLLLYIFAMDDILREAGGNGTDDGVELLFGKRLLTLNHARDIALVCNDGTAVQCVLERYVSIVP